MDLFLVLFRLALRPIITKYYGEPFTSATILAPTKTSPLTLEDVTTVDYTDSQGRERELVIDLNRHDDETGGGDGNPFFEMLLSFTQRHLPFYDHDAYPKGYDPHVEFMRIATSIPNLADAVSVTWIDQLNENPTSDRVLMLLISHGPAATLLKNVEEWYEIDLNTDLWKLPVRPGFDNYGAKLRVNISKLGVLSPIDITWTTPSGLLFTMHRSTPGSKDWDLAKRRFRSTFMFWMTLALHLIETHLLVAGSLFTTSIRILPASHPIRLLLTPFHFRTGRINRAAAEFLIPPGGVLHRVSALTEEGLSTAISLAIQKCQPHGNTFMAKQTDTYVRSEYLKLPFMADAVLYYDNVYETVKKLINQLYPKDIDVQNDMHVEAWLRNLLENAAPNDDFKWSPLDVNSHLNRMELATVISKLIFAVTARHEWYGSVIPYVKNPEFCPLSLQTGSNIPGRTQTEMTWWLALFVTAPMPNVGLDFSHVATDDNIRTFFSIDWINCIKNIRSVISHRNTERVVPCDQSNPDMISSSVAI